MLDTESAESASSREIWSRGPAPSLIDGFLSARRDRRSDRHQRLVSFTQTVMPTEFRYTLTPRILVRRQHAGRRIEQAEVPKLLLELVLPDPDRR